MSDTPSPWWETLRSWVRHHLAYLAVRHLGPAALYWCNPTEWDAYMSEGNDAVSVPESIRDTLFDALSESAEHMAIGGEGHIDLAIAWLDEHTYDKPEGEVTA